MLSLYPEALSSTAWGFSKLKVLHVRLLDAVAAIAMSKLQSVNGQSIADKVSLPANAQVLWRNAAHCLDGTSKHGSIASCNSFYRRSRSRWAVPQIS